MLSKAYKANMDKRQIIIHTLRLKQQAAQKW